MRPDEAPLALIAPSASLPKQNITIKLVLRLAIIMNEGPNESGRLDGSTATVDNPLKLGRRGSIKIVTNAKTSMLIAVVTPKKWVAVRR